MQHRIGTVYGVMLNDRASLVRLAGQFDKDPYKAAPRAPILYIKPANTICATGSSVLVPASPGQVQIGATIGAVIGQSATQVNKSNALSHLAGFRLVADISLPHESFYRPAIRERCRDGFCPIGPLVNPAHFDVSNALTTVSINGSAVEQRTLADSVRSIEQLLIDVTEFMTLMAGDVLLLGLSDRPPVAHAGDTVSVQVASLGELDFVLEAEQSMVPR